MSRTSIPTLLLGFLLLVSSSPTLAENEGKYVFVASADLHRKLQDLGKQGVEPSSILKEVRENGTPIDGETHRLLFGAGAVVEIYCFDRTACFFGFDEKPRRSRIEEDLRTLLKGVSKATGLGAAADDEPTVSWSSYRLVEDRGTLEITAGQIEDGRDAGSTGDLDPQATKLVLVVDLFSAGQPSVLKAKVATGTAERWFLTADVPVNKPDVLKFDEDSKTLQLRETPSEFHLGLNYSLGDVASDPPELRDAVFLKVLLHPSSEPLQSWGLGVGLRGKRFKWVDLSPLTLFAARMWVESDELDAMGAPVVGGRSEADWRFGLGLNLTEALSWIK